MELKVASTLFSSSGGGGGGFYFGRNPQEAEEATQEQDTEPGELSNDVVSWSLRSRNRAAAPWRPATRSRLPLGLPAAAALEPAEDKALTEAEVGALQAELLGKIRVLTFAVTRLETSFERRLHAEVGNLLIG